MQCVLGCRSVSILRMRMRYPRATIKTTGFVQSFRLRYKLMQRRHDLVCNCSGVSVTEACGVVSNRVPLGGMAQSPNTTSEEVRKKVLEIKAEAEENKICADCKRVGESVLLIQLEESHQSFLILLSRFEGVDASVVAP